MLCLIESLRMFFNLTFMSVHHNTKNKVTYEQRIEINSLQSQKKLIITVPVSLVYVIASRNFPTAVSAQGDLVESALCA